jgi:hypothetical protein
MAAIRIPLRFVRRRNHALFMLSHTAGHFLLPRTRFINLLCGLSQRSSIPSCAANGSRSNSIAAVVIRELNRFRGFANLDRGSGKTSQANAGVVQSVESQPVESTRRSPAATSARCASHAVWLAFAILSLAPGFEILDAPS